MSAKHPAKEKILEIGSEIIQQNGFNNTGIQQVLTAAGVPKGSFYYYFKSKEDFGLQLIDYFAGRLSFMFDEHLKDEHIPPLQGLRRFFNGLATYFEENDFKGG